MVTDNSKATVEAHIRGIIEERVKAIRAKDINALMSNYASDAVSFDALNPLQNNGSDAGRKRAEAWFASYQSSINYEIRDLHVKAGEAVAFCHYLYRVSGTTTSGEQVDMWVRATICFSEAEGKWVVTHEHDSVPFDVETGRASLDLKP